MKGTEVEFRFNVDDEKRARAFLGSMKFLGKKKQKDVYFDTRDGGLYKRGVFIRLRNGKILDFKFNLEDDAHEDCDEHSFHIPLSPEDREGLDKVCETLGLNPPRNMILEEFLRMNMLRELVTIDKVRENFSDGEFAYSFDKVRGFGLFMEIESMAESGTDMESLKRRMREIVSPLNPRFIPVGYIEFFMRELDFDLYKLGKYLFDEDKK